MWDNSSLYDTCVGRSKVERTFYHALLIRLFVDHSYDSVLYSMENGT